MVAGGCLILYAAWTFIPVDAPETATASKAPTNVAAFGSEPPSSGVSERSAAPARDPERHAVAPGALQSVQSAASATQHPNQAPAGTLNDRVERALSMKDGSESHRLAGMLSDCEIYAGSLAVESSKGADPGASPELLAIRAERLQDYQRKISACQTVPGDHRLVRRRLLNLAVDQAVPTAAVDNFQLGSRDPATLARLFMDASAGDLRSLATVAMYDAQMLGISRDQQDAARYALTLGAADPHAGAQAGTYLKIAKSYAELDASFDGSRMSSAARELGEEIARQPKRLGRKTD